MERAGDAEVPGGSRCEEVDEHGICVHHGTEDGGAPMQGGRQTQASTAVIIGQAPVSPWRRNGGISSGRWNPIVHWSLVGVHCGSDAWNPSGAVPGGL
jgi:hypothetical protein